ncbi:hypothetical protein D6745_05695 [Candidatus Woesearchaeota archaeon]|nr:MAG: hypothetical protein D6745_05695 [Candidatus Woesearchaeota archaeon]
MVSRRLVFYSVPLLSVIILGIIFIMNEPKLTGMVVYRDVADFNVSVSTAEGELLPEGTMIVVRIDNHTAEMPLKDFINKSGGVFQREYGSSSVVDYTGWGYIGNHTYTLSIQEFNMTPFLNAGSHTAFIALEYNGETISNSNKSFSVV